MTTKTRSTAWIVLVCLADPASAQDAGPFAELAQRVEAGDEVRVTFSGGRDRNAQVVGVTPLTLSVLDRGTKVALGEADVWFVHHREDDPTGNGFWVGFAAGVASGTLWYLGAYAREGVIPRPGTSHLWAASLGRWAPGSASAWTARSEERRRCTDDGCPAVPGAWRLCWRPATAASPSRSPSERAKTWSAAFRGRFRREPARTPARPSRFAAPPRGAVPGPAGFSARGTPAARSACPWNLAFRVFLIDTDHGTRHVPCC